ncbi:glycosyl transferase [Candidatus Shapirobacteria bacterium CG08_land_8_20_14_0_20_39_18]|uniref:Glycosyl transferase n=1 Tax=Candidatus Shapirobacteria bacterium CG08_land_8_20_14_0_20_39_18 TaxID=1974883 RepID=A0A2M6XC05_9BACT|nr:MAG: glycosyl transferase [Candidatus Shapirobacteria bacterium CG08_land_8_20_14_0_20_39_18]PIY65385.1 MAG: glycosyl transferase [Candidatus Shapirobacteria bacterium CG_4_10_14_0_8_um_filter_39_15]
MFISVVLSFYNEEKVIPELIQRLRASLAIYKKNYELIFVNDDSIDNSLVLLKKAARGHKDIKIINMSRNFGVGGCVMAGLKHTCGDAVIYMDADLQDPPELIPKLITAWKESQDTEIVNTVRITRAGEHPIKLWLTKVGYFLLKSVSDIKITPNAGDFKLLSRKAVNELIKLEEEKPFIRGLVSLVGFKQAQVFYHRDARWGGKTKFPIYSRKVIDNFLESALISFSDAPLKISLLLGFLVSMGAFLYLAIIFIMKLFNLNLPGWSAIMATMFFLGGIQLLTIGVLGLYIGAIYRQTRNRPNYIIKSLVGFGKGDIK